MLRRIVCNPALHLALCACLTLSSVLVPTLVSAQRGALSLAAEASPSAVIAEQTVTYTVTVRNALTSGAEGASVAVDLPEGFAYVVGSTRIYGNATQISSKNPTIGGRTLTWSGLTVPPARTASNLGVHTFVQDKCDVTYIGWQLDRVREAMGAGAYVKQLVYGITEATTGPQGCWVDFVNGCYDRGLIPVVRLGGPYDGPNWRKPEATSPGDYTAIAEAYARVVDGLPRRNGQTLYVEVWNEPNLDIEWSGAPNPIEYAEFLVDVAAAIRALGDGRIAILNGALSPGGNYDSLAFIDAMATVPGAMQAFDVWASHPYPGNHPPEYNIHDGTATEYQILTIDSYLLELDRLAAHGRTGVRVLLTETGYALGNNSFGFQGYAAIDENNRADYISRALRDYWSRWPEVLGVCPYELVDPHGGWTMWDWLYRDGGHHRQYDAVTALDKTPITAPGNLKLVFQARAGFISGTYGSAIEVSSSNAGSASLTDAAPVQVMLPTPTPTRTPTLTPAGTATHTPTPSPTPLCWDLVYNGGFERDEAWELPETAYPAVYTAEQAHNGARSVRVGVVGEATAVSYSSARQAFRVPDDATALSIRYWYYAVSGDTAHGRQYVLLLDENKTYLETVQRISENAAGWQYAEYTIPRYAGRTLWLQFGAYNDGLGVSGTAMYVDDVTVSACGPQSAPTGTPTAAASATVGFSRTPTRTPTVAGTTTPTATRTVTRTATSVATVTPGATPTPVIVCDEGVLNGDFEARLSWISLTDVNPRYCRTQPLTGEWAMCLGIEPGEPNVYRYSSVEQTVDLPANARVTLTFRYYPISSDAGKDTQYVLAVFEDGSYSPLLWVLSNAQTWLAKEADLSGFAGQRVTLRFGVYNDGQGGVTAMRMDDVSLQVCVDAAAGRRPFLPLIIKGVGSALMQAMAAPSVGIGEDLPQRPAGLTSLLTPIRAAESARVDAVAVDSAHGRVISASGSRVTARDAVTGAELWSRYVAGDVTRLMVRDETGEILVLLAARGEALLLGREGDERAVIAELGRPTNAVEGDGVLFVADSGGKRIVALDGQSLVAVRTREFPQAPAALACDPLRQRLYVGLMGSGDVLALDAVTLRTLGKVTLEGLGLPQDLALDADAQRLYVAHALAPKYGALTVIDTASLGIVGDLWGSPDVPLIGSDAVRVVAEQRSLYLAQATGCLVLDPDRLTVRQNIVVGERLVSGLAVDALDGTLYLAGAQGELWTWRAAAP